jgi:hypothetical protein
MCEPSGCTPLRDALAGRATPETAPRRPQTSRTLESCRTCEQARPPTEWSDLTGLMDFTLAGRRVGYGYGLFGYAVATRPEILSSHMPVFQNLPVYPHPFSSGSQSHRKSCSWAQPACACERDQPSDAHPESRRPEPGEIVQDRPYLAPRFPVQHLVAVLRDE